MIGTLIALFLKGVLNDMIKIVFFTIGLAAIGWQSGYIMVNKNQEIFVARVSLEETCEFDTNVFAIKNINTGEVIPFLHGEAFIRASQNDELKVVMNEKYGQITFDGDQVKAMKRVHINQSCKAPTSLQSVFESFNETFSTN